MALNQQHTASTLTDGEVQLPLYSFFISLKQNGFLVTPAQIADSHAVIAEYAGSVSNEAELSDYLSPLFANNEEEQVLFQQLYDQFFIEDAQAGSGKIGEQTALTRHLKIHWWKYLLVLAILLLIGLFFIGRSDEVKKDNVVWPSNYDGKERTDGDAFSINTNDTLKVYPQISSLLPDTTIQVSFNTTYSWGDKTAMDSTGEHLYKTKGIYALRAIADVYYDGKFRYADTLQGTVKVCDENNRLSIENSLATDSLILAQHFRLTANVIGRQPDTIKWSDGDQWLRTGTVFDSSFDDEGWRTIYCVAIYDSMGSPCSMEQTISLFVYNPYKPILTAFINKAPNAQPVNLPRKVKTGWFILTGALFLLSFAGMLVFSKWYQKNKQRRKKEQKETDRLYNDLTSKFSGKKPPFDLPFRTKNSLLFPEPGLNEVAWQMRKRIEDESTYLHLQKTIQRAIRHAGFFDPVKVPRTHQSEYLVLIDETIINNQQVKLFEYLVELLRKQNVFVDKFYYRKEPKLCYNVFEPTGVSLEKLNEKFPRHILFILGNAHQLIYPHYPIFDPAYLQLIKRWKYRAILTPAPVPDWGHKEKNVLGEEMIVVPADVYGQLLLMEHLFTGQSITAPDLNEYGDQFYKVAPIDFEDADELIRYCNEAGWARIKSSDLADNIIFQWIAALALYPRIRWEMIVAIGKAIVERYGKAEEITFTNLLFITRIKWMTEGRFPDYTRLELLKRLKIENEVVARETILQLLNEIPAHEINSDHFVFEEKEIQRIVNEFNLFACDPKKYASYETSKLLFEKLWKEKKILDAPAKAYLKNKDREWNTLVNKNTGSKDDTDTENVSIEEYFDMVPVEPARLKTVKLWTGICISLIFLGSLLGLIALTILNFVNSSRFSTFTYKKDIKRNVFFTYKDSTALGIIGNVTLNVDTSLYMLLGDSAVPVPILFNDSPRNVAVWVKYENAFDSEVKFTHDAYIVSLKASDPTPAGQPATNIITARLYIARSCAAAIYDYKRNISEAGNNITIYDSILQNGTSAKGAPCLNKITYGRGVDTGIVQKIIQNFRGSGPGLVITSQAPFPVGDNELAIYYQDTSAVSAPLPEKRPILSIYLSDESLRASAAGFKKELESKGYTVNTMNVTDFDTNSEINYYSASIIKQAAAVQQIYRRYYPQLPIPLKLIDNSRLAGNETYIRIYIKKLEDGTKLPLKLNASGSKVGELKTMLIRADYKLQQNNLFDQATEMAVKDFQSKNKMAVDGIVGEAFWKALTDFVATSSPDTNENSYNQQATVPNNNASIADIAEKEIGEKENPAGSNQTKYGKWYGSDEVEWSGIFVSWVYSQAGNPLPRIETDKGFASFRTALSYFQKNNMITQKPVAGDIVIVIDPNYDLYWGGIFAGWTRVTNSFRMIAAAVEKTSKKSEVADLRLTNDPKTTYFVHLPRKTAGKPQQQAKY